MASFRTVVVFLLWVIDLLLLEAIHSDAHVKPPALLRSEPASHAREFHDRASYLQVNQAARSYASELEHDLASWYGSRELAAWWSSTRPPKCAHDAPDDPYWKELGKVGVDHTDCDFGMCGQFIQNQERMDSIRNVTHATKKLLVGAHISDWFLDSGTAIGALRCQDVLPWDVDCDVMVPEKGIMHLYESFFNTTDYTYRNMSADIDARYVIRAKASPGPNCIPFAVVDKHTGFYCDVMQSRQLGGFLQNEFPWGSSDVENLGCSEKGFKWPVMDVLPTRDCMFNNEVYPCPNNLKVYLQQEFPSGVSEPDVKVTG